MNNKNISLIIPYYNDSKTIESLVSMSSEFLRLHSKNFEIIIVNDGSPDNPIEMLNNIKKVYSNTQIVHHKNNTGYGSTFKSGVKNSRYQLILMLDGDNEYDVFEFEKFLRVADYYSMIIGFRYKKLYSTKRIFVSFAYNVLVRILFKTPYRDISTGIRLIKRSALEEINFNELSNSPFFGAELAIKIMLKGYPVGEIGIQTFPRTFGSGNATSLKNIYLTIKDLLRVRNQIFSDNYDLPANRKRDRLDKI